MRDNSEYLELLRLHQ
nr:unnamed protein product [Callosobruchus analis]